MTKGLARFSPFQRPVELLAKQNETGTQATATTRSAAKSPSAPYLLSGEDVVLYAVDLPNLTSAQRRAAAAFAVEELIAQPLHRVRVVLGPQYPATSGKWLVAVVDAAVLADAADQAGQNRPVLAETMMLQIPSVGWLVEARADRILVRRDDGSGFALDRDLFVLLWQMQGKPPLIGSGDVLPDDCDFASRQPSGIESTALPPWSFDLTAIAGRRPSYAKRPRWLWVAGFAALALSAHLALTALDVYATRRLAAESMQKLSEAVGANAAAGENPVATATRLLAAQGAQSAPAFLSLVTRAVAALPSGDKGVSLRGLRFDEKTGQLVLAVIAPDITTLQDVEAALNAAGLVAVAGPASSRNGAAEAEMTLTAGVAQ